MEPHVNKALTWRPDSVVCTPGHTPAPGWLPTPSRAWHPPWAPPLPPALRRHHSFSFGQVLHADARLIGVLRTQ